MSEQEYKQFLMSLFKQYIGKNIPIPRLVGRVVWRRRLANCQGGLARLKKAMPVIDYINQYCKKEEDVYKIFRKGKLISTIDDIRLSVRTSEYHANRLEYLSAIDSHFAEILDGMEPEYFPPEELEILRGLGSRDPKADLVGIIYLLKAKKKELVSSIREIPASKQLHQIEEILEKEKGSIEEQDKFNPGLPLFKALGKIVPGTGLLISDLLLAFGLLCFPVSPETKTWGSVMSVNVGFGMILTGVGILRNE